MSALARSDPFHIARLAETGLQFAAVLHEVRQPLAGIQLALKLALRQATSAEQRVALEDARSELQRLADLLDSACSSCLQQGRAASEDFDLPAVLARVVRLLEPSLRRRGIALQSEVGPLPLVRAGVSAVEQVLFNLINNGRDSLLQKGQGGRLLLRASVEQGRVALVVADDGVGIPAGEEERAFEPYVTSKGSGGTGLGLYIARELATSFGGELCLLDPLTTAALAAPSPVTAFCLWLPLAGDAPGSE